MRQVGVGVIGVGYIGQVHAQIYSRLPGARIVGVADVDAARANEVAARLGCKAFADYEELLSQPGLEGVSICTPDALHREPVLAAARHKKHVLLEKPIASTLEDAEAIVNAVRQSGILCELGFVERFHKPFIVAQKAVQEGAIGKLISVRSQRLNIRDAAKRVATRDPIISFLAIHDIDLLMWFAGPIKRVSAEAGTFVFGNPDLEDSAFILVRFESGALGSIQVSWGLSDSLPFRASAKLELIGDKGIINVDTVDDSVVVNSEAGHRYPIGFDRSQAFEAELSHFLECIDKGVAPKVGVDEGLAALKVALAARESARDARPRLI
ncbi:MAG TPA: Gfo/Idh/MocA family oxidoreductase [Firmicutes bacterium]|nr:Gfo/Idh/MocA family oxidoreductase [Bacillota bacterium]